MTSFVRRSRLTALNWWESTLHTVRAPPGSEQPRLGPNKLRPFCLLCPSWLALSLTRSCQIPWYTCGFNKTASQLGLDTPRGSPALNSTAEFVSVAETFTDCLKPNQNNKKPDCWKLHIGQSLPGETNLLTKITHVCPYHKRHLHCKRAAVASPCGPGQTLHPGPAEILSFYLTQCKCHGCYHTSSANEVKYK